MSVPTAIASLAMTVGLFENQNPSCGGCTLGPLAPRKVQRMGTKAGFCHSPYARSLRQQASRWPRCPNPPSRRPRRSPARWWGRPEHPRPGAVFFHSRSGFAGDFHVVHAGGGRRAVVPATKLSVSRARFRRCPFVGIDEYGNMLLSTLRLTVGLSVQGLAARERAAQQFADQRQARALCSPKGRIAPDGSITVKRGSVAGLPWSSMMCSAPVARPYCRPRGSCPGRFCWWRSPARSGLLPRAECRRRTVFGAVAGVAAAKGRNDRPRQHVHEWIDTKAMGDTLFGPVADAPDMVRVGEADHAHAVTLGAFGAQFHGLKAHHLARSRRLPSRVSIAPPSITTLICWLILRPPSFIASI